MSKTHPLARRAQPRREVVVRAAPEQTKLAWLQRRWVMALLVVLAAFLVYAPSLDAGWTDTDDIQLIVEDSHFLMNASPLPDVFQRPLFPAAGSAKHYYRPLVTLSFLIDARRAGGILPAAFHATNILLHALSCLLLLAIVEHVTQSAVLALAAALVFAVHPAAVQTVAWVPGRSDGLMAVFALGSLLAWLNYDRSRSRAWLLAHLALLALALLSKETAVALVPLCVSYSWFATRQTVHLRNARPWLGWLIVLGGWWVLRSSEVDATKVDLQVVLQNTPMLVASFGKLMRVVDLQVLATLRDTIVWPGWLAVVLLALAGAWLLPDQRRMFLWAAVGLPLLVLAPALVASDVLILDNRLYLTTTGLVLGLALLAREAVRTKPSWAAPLASALALVVVLLGAATLRYARAFESPMAFCEAAVAGSPHLALAHVNLGSAHFRAHDLTGAAQQFSDAIALDPRWPVAHNNLGLVYLNQGQLTQAEQEFTTELAVNPDYPKAHYNLGLVLANTGRQQEASVHFERVVQLVPSDVSAWGELLKYWGPRDAQKAAQIIAKMEQLGVRFHSP